MPDVFDRRLPLEGTNTHVVLEDAVETVTLVEVAPVFKRQSFAWQARRHALLSRTLRSPEGTQVFAQPFAGKLLQLVSRSPRVREKCREIL